MINVLLVKIKNCINFVKFNRAVIYRNKYNDSVFKGVFESMIPGSCVHATVIDVWAMQLSSTEAFRSRSSPVRVFMPITIQVRFLCIMKKN